MDRGRGIFADPNKVHHLNYQGRWFTSMAPLTVPPHCPQAPPRSPGDHSGRPKRAGTGVRGPMA